MLQVVKKITERGNPVLSTSSQPQNLPACLVEKMQQLAESNCLLRENCLSSSAENDVSWHWHLNRYLEKIVNFPTWKNVRAEVLETAAA